MAKTIEEIEQYGGVEKAVEDGWLQMKIARRASERKQASDSGQNVIVGQNYFRRKNQSEGAGEIFTLDPKAAAKVIAKYEQVLDTRNSADVKKSLAALEAAAIDDNKNLIPYLIDCCHAYATVGEMISTLKSKWGEFQEPVRF